MKVKQQTTSNKRTGKKPATTPIAEPMLKDARFAQIATDLITFSPLNYRKYYSEKALLDFSEELKQHGIISPLTVRQNGKDKYELIAGERRLRAARMAGLPFVPVGIVSMTDEQVTEIQLAENLQRENPHPLDEAQAVQRMLDSGKKIEEIALRLGKSRQFVFVRLKLMKLEECFHALFYQNKMTLQQSLEIALLSSQAQQAFFEEQCSEWEEEDFELEDISWTINQYKCDLINAPFDTSDKKLLPEIGACSGCPFNSASLKSLFPELAEKAVCSNKTCYQQKTLVAWQSRIQEALVKEQPVALIVYANQMERVTKMMKDAPLQIELAIYEYNQVTTVSKPTEPEQENYTLWDEEGEDMPDVEGYEEAKQEYAEELAAYQLLISSGKATKGLFIRQDEMVPVLFTTEPRSSYQNEESGKRISQKALQEAIKAKTATADMFREVIHGMEEREERAQELDEEKILAEVHRQLLESTTDEQSVEGLTEADQAAAAYLIYNGLDYATRRKVDELLLDKIPEQSANGMEDTFRKLAGLTEQQYSYLIRVALLSKPDSKNTRQQAGYQLTQMATQAGVKVTVIRQGQQARTEERQDRLKTRLTDLGKQMKRLEKKQE